MIILGLTGSIGMGKSATAAMVREVGVPVFDADAVVHDLYAHDAVVPVEAAFAGVAVDGRIDRDALRARIVGDPAALRRLEAIVHPLVRQRRDAFLATARSEGRPIVVLDIPLLFETGMDRTVDAVMVVSAPEDVQRARVLARPGMTETAFSAILAQQVPDAEKRRRADYVIETGGGFAEARSALNAILRAVVAKQGTSNDHA